MRQIVKTETTVEPCLWMGCDNNITHEVINVAGQIEASGCEFHAHMFKRHQDNQSREASKAEHPSTDN